MVSLAQRPSRRALLFAAFVGVCLLFAVAYTAWAVLRERQKPRAADVSGAPAPAGALELLQNKDAVLFRSTAMDQDYGRTMLVPASDPAAQPMATPLSCERIAYMAGQGVCLSAERGVLTTYAAQIFGDTLQQRHQLTLAGGPSRTRVSADGRYAATTVFVTGHSYAAGGFSTQTLIVDLATGSTIGDLEQWTVTRDGQTIQAPDFNFWGVTFARDSNRFYATLGTDGTTYLVEGDVAARHMRVIHEQVECPSLSPDNTRLVYKLRTGPEQWRLQLLDLRTMQSTALAAETRSVDDQVEWLDDGHILYELPDGEQSAAVTNVWELAVDGSSAPRLFLAHAASPAVVR